MEEQEVETPQPPKHTRFEEPVADSTEAVEVGASRSGKEETTFQVDQKKPIAKSFYRLTEKIKLTDFEAIAPEAFRNWSKDPHLPGIAAMLKFSSRVGLKVDSNDFELTEARDVIISGLIITYNSTNVFHNEDLEDKGRGNKKEMAQFEVRLTQTPVRALPSWDESKRALVKPGFFEKLWYAAYLQFGAVAELNECLLQTMGDKAPTKPNPGAKGAQQRPKPGPLPPNPYTKKVKSS